ncbi:phosphoglucosamine mutase [Hoyosella sp. YIM 151337]|uniref:phosphoglucosamine mutase n=1 Tax=Hoyosella sp. YIM 151337 TaxID=2992742 RepID=UPI002236BE3B|nr:phosphoglucosamine mutase [Hoyosella sp. YIM 151337]MCW4352522.1 phosphoglucosamine mutase [Hoyosella sp. YIM 151337]
MSRLFGTDGVRGLANAELTAELAVSLAGAAATTLTRGAHDPLEQKHTIAVVGRDPRASGEMLEAAICAGLTAAGVDVLRAGVLPTPAVAYLTGAYGAALGVMISASHNPMPDNGIKIFGPGGHKLDDATENQIEAEMRNPSLHRPTGAAIGRISDATDAAERYLAHLATAIDSPLAGLTVVVDCAHGAAAHVAPAAYEAAGATVIPINNAPDGLNINESCGSTHISVLQEAVAANGADLGLAHDGDADRCLAVDDRGNVVDGDAIMAILALGLKDSGQLRGDTLVATVMSNLGLHLAMRDAGITLRTTAVGDRYVVEELKTGGFSLGGEQSGHIVLPEYGMTGDGILTGLKLMARMSHSRKSLHDLAAVMRVLPQVLINVSVADKAAVAAAAAVQTAVSDAERALGDSGRVLLRPSGTEQLVRVMVEAASAEQAQHIAEDLAKVVASV